MSHKFEEGKDLIIDAVVEKLQKNLDGKQATCCAEFARQFFATVALDDLHDWSLDDLSGMVMNFWSLIQRRKPGEAKIRIYHPELEQDGWKKNHTVLEVICDTKCIIWIYISNNNTISNRNRAWIVVEISILHFTNHTSNDI